MLDLLASDVLTLTNLLNSGRRCYSLAFSNTKFNTVTRNQLKMTTLRVGKDDLKADTFVWKLSSSFYM